MGRLLRTTDLKSQAVIPSSSTILRQVELAGLTLEPVSRNSPVPSAAGMTAQHVALETAAGYSYQWIGRAHYLALHDLHLTDGEAFSDSLPVDRRRDLRGLLTFVPAGCRIWGWSIPRSPQQSFTALYFDPRQMERELAEKAGGAPSRPLIHFNNPVLRANLERLRFALSGNAPRDTLYLETLCLVALLEVCVIQKAGLAALSRPAGQLSKAHEQRIREFIDSNLSRDVSLAELSAVVGLSRFHFLRAFKQATHETPYRYLVRRRIEQAHQLLKTSDRPVSQIALDVGFKDATRFIRAFHRIKGVTPGKWRTQRDG